MFTFVYYSLASTRRRESARERQGEREQVKEWKNWKILEIFLSFCARCNMLFYSQLVALFLAENFLFLFTTRTACKCKKILLQLLLFGMMMPRKFLTYSHPGINVVDSPSLPSKYFTCGHLELQLFCIFSSSKVLYIVCENVVYPQKKYGRSLKQHVSRLSVLVDNWIAIYQAFVIIN